MLRILGNRATACDGTTRREVLRAGGLSLFGTMTLPRLLQAAEREPGRAPGRARSIILLNLFGGPSHLDMFDMKPGAPLEVRGEFQPIATSLAGLQICEHMPRLAQWMHKATLIRSVTHGYNSHNPYAVLTGFTGGNDQENYFTKRSDHPGIGSVCQHLDIGPPRPSRLGLSAQPCRATARVSGGPGPMAVISAGSSIPSLPIATRSSKKRSTRIDRSTTPCRPTASRDYRRSERSLS